MTDKKKRTSQCQNPRGWLGRLVLRNMNARHSKVTDWGLSHVSIVKTAIILDVGCGGGRTVDKLAALAGEGEVVGVDFSSESVAMAGRVNQKWIDAGRVEIRQAPVSRLPFPDGTFDVVTAVETHFWWPDLPSDMREVLRVLKPGGMLVVIAEVYKGANTTTARLLEKHAASTGLTLLSVDEHRDLLAQAGYSDIQVITETSKGWICCTARKR